MHWTLSDEKCIHCIEARIREIEEGADGNVYPFTRKDCLVWLARHKDGQSWAEIARKFGPRWVQAKGKRARENQSKISWTRRAHDRVERHLNRSGDDFEFCKNARETDLLELILNVVSSGMASLVVPQPTVGQRLDRKRGTLQRTRTGIQAK